MLQNFVSVFQPNPNGKEHEDCMKESVTFESLPNCLSFHIIRTKHRMGANSQSFLAKDETPLSVNLVRTAWLPLSHHQQHYLRFGHTQDESQA